MNASPAIVKATEAEKIEIGLATLYRGDCVAVTEILGKVDHTITDPPYEEEAHTEFRQTKSSKGVITRKLVFGAMDEITRAQITKLIAEKTNGWVLFFCQVEANDFWRRSLEKAGGKYHGTMAWVKPDAKPNFRGTGPGVGYENIVVGWCGEGHSSWNGGGKTGVFIVNKNEQRTHDNTHMTIKPQKLMSELVNLFTNTGEIILDTFMGSGSTGVAAVNAGRRFIGIERDPEYFEISCRRIEAAQKSDLVTTSVYVKTKAKVAVPLFEQPEKKKPVVAKAAAKRVVASTKPRFSIPTINVDTRSAAARISIPWSNPFEEYAKPLITAAQGRPLTFNDWPGTNKNLLAMDVECYRNCFMICFKNLRNGEHYVLERSTRTDFKGSFVRDIIENNRIITFNGLTYDMPMVFLAIAGATTAELKEASDTIIKERLHHWEIERKIPRAKVPFGLDHIDLFEPNPAVRTGLKVLGARMHGRYLVNLPFEEHRSLTADEMNFLTLYCLNDLDDTESLYEHLTEPLELRRKLSKEYKMDLRSKSDAQVGEAIVKKRLVNVGRPPPMGSFFNYKVPPFITFESGQMREVVAKLAGSDFTFDQHNKVIGPEWLEGLEIRLGNSVYRMGKGGLHSTEETRALHSDDEYVLVDIDVASQYPNIIMKVGLYPKAAGEKFLEVYGAMIKERMTAKLEQQRVEREIKAATDLDVISKLKEEREMWKAKTDGLKISLNGVYGKLGSMFSYLYAPDIMIAVTMTGQLSLLMLIERFERAGFPVVSGNTDGVVVRCRRDLVTFNDKGEVEGGTVGEIMRKWEEDTGFLAESTKYKSIYNSSVNTYFAVKENGKIKRKGPAANPWAEEDYRGLLSKNPQMTVVGDAVAEFILKQTPFEETIRACTDMSQFVTVTKAEAGAKWREHRLGGVVRYYWSTDGDPVLYVNSNRKVAKTDGARPLIELTGKLPRDVDYDRYIAEAEKLAIDMAVISEKGALL